MVKSWRFYRFMIGLALYALLAPVLAACAPAAPAAPTEIVLGAALPLTGGQAREGGYFKKGYELAIKEINDAGGIMVKEYNKKIPVKLIIYDDKSDNTTSVQLYEKLVTEDKVHALLGGYGTPLISAHTVVPEKYQVPYVNGGGATGEIYARNMKYIFGLLASIEKLAHTLMDWMAEQQDAGKLKKPVTIAVVGENSSHGKEFRKGVLDKAAAAPDRFKVVMDEPFELNLKDADPLLQKLKAANADVFLADARIADYTTIHRRYTELGLSHLIVSYGPRGTEKAARDALGAAADYIVSCNWWHPDIPTPEAKAFAEKYQKAYNERPEWFPALAYETARVMAKAIENAGTLDKTKVRDALAKTDLKPSLVVGGRVWFEANGQINNDYVMMQNLPGGKVALIYPKSVATADAIVPIPKK
jgi:branched-chain amino acid transport system substrate-binding protein